MTPARQTRGYTLTEMAVTMGIVAVLAAGAYDLMSRARPRATFDGVTAEIHSLVHGARQQALASGLPVVVLVYPDYRGQGSQGRLIVLQDDPVASLLQTSSALNLDNYDPGVLAYPSHDPTANPAPNGQLITSLDLPQGVNVGPVGGLGVANVPFPYNSITTNVACSFCNAGGNHRGAIVFDSRGRATFYSAAGTTSGNANGASFSIYGTELTQGSTVTTSTFVVTSASGSLRTFHNG